MKYTSCFKKKGLDKRKITILLAAIIIVGGGLLLKKIADSQSRVDY